MTQTRYERLNTNGNNQDENNHQHTAMVRRSSFSARYNDDDDNENEEIELGTGHRRLHYEDEHEDDDNDEHSVAFYGRNASANARDNAHHHESGLAGGGVSSSAASHLPLGSSRVMQMAIGTLATILMYLALSITLTFYQQKLLKKLKFPLSIVSYHLVVKFFLAASVRAVYEYRMGKSRVQLDWRTSVRKMAPTGIASGIDIGFSNWGLELVPISLYTMTKSSTIVFILFFAILLGLEKKSWLLVSIVGLIAIGLFMFTYESAQFDALGFMFILVASFSSGVRWSFAQFVMQKTKLGLHNPIDMIFHMQPWMIASILPFLVAFEGQKLYDVLRDLSGVSNDVIYMNFFYISVGAVLAFLMEVSEFLVLSKTSSLTLSIAGIFKDICQLALGVELNGDQLSVVNICGLVVCLAGISCHLIHKYSSLTKVDSFDAIDNDSLQFNETSININGGNSSGGGGSTTMTGVGANNHTTMSSILLKQKHSAQTVPLLDQTDSDDSNNDDNEQNASDVIFDVLKRRDMQR